MHRTRKRATFCVPGKKRYCGKFRLPTREWQPQLWLRDTRSFKKNKPEAVWRQFHCMHGRIHNWSLTHAGHILIRLAETLSNCHFRLMNPAVCVHQIRSLRQVSHNRKNPLISWPKCGFHVKIRGLDSITLIATLSSSFAKTDCITLYMFLRDKQSYFPRTIDLCWFLIFHSFKLRGCKRSRWNVNVDIGYASARISLFLKWNLSISSWRLTRWFL